MTTSSKSGIKRRPSSSRSSDLIVNNHHYTNIAVNDIQTKRWVSPQSSPSLSFAFFIFHQRLPCHYHPCALLFLSRLYRCTDSRAKNNEGLRCTQRARNVQLRIRYTRLLKYHLPANSPSPPPPTTTMTTYFHRTGLSFASRNTGAVLLDQGRCGAKQTKQNSISSFERRLARGPKDFGTGTRS